MVGVYSRGDGRGELESRNILFFFLQLIIFKYLVYIVLIIL